MLPSSLCYRLSARRAFCRKAGDAGQNAATFDAAAYVAWRSEQLAEQLEGFIDLEELGDRDVLDFGCGHGDLSFLVAQRGAPRSLLGLDVSRERVETAEERAAALDLPHRPRFACSATTDRIDLDDASVDDILCFDVLEHVMDYEAIIPEWRRVLRPGGRIYIWWVPWWNPWGPHIESLVPIPWAHVLWSDRALLRTCARIYDDERFEPRVWDLDKNGSKKPNKWRTMERLPEVNRLSMGRFERLARHAGLAIDERRIRGFGGSRLSRLTRVLTRVPLVRELFCSYVTYRLSPR